MNEYKDDKKHGSSGINVVSGSASGARRAHSDTYAQNHAESQKTPAPITGRSVPGSNRNSNTRAPRSAHTAQSMRTGQNPRSSSSGQTLSSSSGQIRRSTLPRDAYPSGQPASSRAKSNASHSARNTAGNTSDKRKKYSNIERNNINAGYESVRGRAPYREKEFDNYNFDLSDKHKKSGIKKERGNAHADNNLFFESVDVDSYKEEVRQKNYDEREFERLRRQRAKNRKSSKKPNPVWLVLSGLEAALSVLLIVLLIILNILPTGWLLLAIIILIILAVGIIITQLRKANRNRKLRIAGRVVCIFMCILLGICNYYVSLTHKAIDVVSNDTGYVINQVHVAVLANDTAQSLQDVKNETFGTQVNFKPLILNEAMDAIEKEAGQKLNTKDYETQIDLIEALYKKEVRVIIFNNDVKGDMIEKHEHFDEEVRIIHTFKSKTVISIKSNSSVNVTEEPFLFFISGNDEYGELSVGGRSDVNMLVAVNPVSRQVLLISIPRDYYVEFPGISNGTRDKITHAGVYGIDAQLDTLQELYGYYPDYYCCVNFSSLIEIIDAIGGVDIDVEKTFTSVDGVDFQEGPSHLDGYHTLHYVREREVFEDGDFARGRHQQQAIEAIIDKLLSSTGLTVYSQLVNTLERVCTTNIPKESISALIKKQLAEGGSWNISKIQAMGEPMMQPSYASGGIPLSVIMPYAKSIQDVKDTMEQLYSGSEVTPYQMGDADDRTYVTEPVLVEEETSEEETTTQDTSSTEEATDETTGDENTDETTGDETGGDETAGDETEDETAGDENTEDTGGDDAGDEESDI